MEPKTVIFLVSIIAQSIHALPVAIDTVQSYSEGWMEIAPSDKDKQINLQFIFRNENIDTLEQILMNVSTPSHPQYGNFYEPDELRQLIAPTQDAVSLIKSWLVTNIDGLGYDDIKSETPNDDILSISTTIKVAEKLLSCSYYDYRSIHDDSIIVSRVRKGTNYFVDDSIASYLYYISPTIRFPFTSHKQKDHINVSTMLPITPTILQKIYSIDDTVGKSSMNSQGILDITAKGAN